MASQFIMALKETQQDISLSGLITASVSNWEDGVNFLLPCLSGQGFTAFLAEYYIEPLNLLSITPAYT